MRKKWLCSSYRKQQFSDEFESHMRESLEFHIHLHCEMQKRPLVFTHQTSASIKTNVIVCANLIERAHIEIQKSTERFRFNVYAGWGEWSTIDQTSRAQCVVKREIRQTAISERWLCEHFRLCGCCEIDKWISYFQRQHLTRLSCQQTKCRLYQFIDCIDYFFYFVFWHRFDDCSHFDARRYGSVSRGKNELAYSEYMHIFAFSHSLSLALCLVLALSLPLLLYTNIYKPKTEWTKIKKL